MVALVCDDQLFLKPTDAGRVYIEDAVEAAPYKGAKPCFGIARERWDDAEWLAEVIKISAAALPVPTRKRRSK